LKAVDRPHRPDDGSPARLIATMVGIVGILLLGSLAWSAVGALFSALGEATSVVATAKPTPTRLVTATPIGSANRSTTPTAAAKPSGSDPTAVVVMTREPTPPPTVIPTPAPTLAATPTPQGSGRAPWILLPQPPPDSRVPPGPLTIEARGRGDAAITSLRLELDGVPLPVSLEQRSESTWRGFATARVGAGQHAVRATVIDEQGRTGGFRWTFEAAP
jgi:hypothetical protein